MGLMKRIATARQWNPELSGKLRDTVALRRIWKYINPRQKIPLLTLPADRVNELFDEAALAKE